MASTNKAEKLYNAVKSGQINPASLNEAGKQTLKNYILAKKQDESQQTTTTDPVRSIQQGLSTMGQPLKPGPINEQSQFSYVPGELKPYTPTLSQKAKEVGGDVKKVVEQFGKGVAEGSLAKPVTDKLFDAKKIAVNRMKKADPEYAKFLGQYFESQDKRLEEKETPKTTPQKVASVAGNITGAIAPLLAAEVTGGASLAGLAGRAGLGTTAQNIARLAGTGATFEGGRAALEGGSPGEVAKQAAEGAALFPAAGTLGKYAGELTGKIPGDIGYYLANLARGAVTGAGFSYGSDIFEGQPMDNEVAAKNAALFGLIDLFLGGRASRAGISSRPLEGELLPTEPYGGQYPAALGAEATPKPNLANSEGIVKETMPLESPVISPKEVGGVKTPETTAEPLIEANAAQSPELLGNPHFWKDKPKLLLKRETMKRNFEDIMGTDAPQMVKRYIEPIEKSEASRVRWLNQERNQIKNLGIKGKSKESELLQKYGEAKITIEQLKDSTPKWEKIVKANSAFREKYDRYLTDVNKVLVGNGYDPIPKRKDYFAHFQEVSDVLEKFGIPVKDNALPTDINGLTSQFKPGKNFFVHALERKGNKTTYDAVQGIDRYLEGISKVIYHTGNIKRLRKLDKAIREQFTGTEHLSNFAAELTEYTNILAGKKAMIDRAVEDIVGRKIYGVVDRLRKQTAANMIGMNVGSALTSFIPLTQSAATTGKKAFVRGMLETIKNTYKDDGFINKSDFLTRRIGSDRLVMNSWDKITNKGYWLFKVIDNFTSQVVVRSAYLDGVQHGLSPELALKRADDWASRAMADRTAGSVPTLFSSKTLGPINQFQLEVNNQLSFAFKDIPRNFDKKGTASAIAQLLIYGYIFNNLFEMAVGRRPAFDPIGVIQKAYQDYTDEDKPIAEANKNLIRNTADQLPFVGIATGGRIPMESVLPSPVDLATGKTTIEKEAKKVAFGLLPPTGGGQIKKTFEGGKALVNEAVSEPSGKTIKYPVERKLENYIKGLLFGPNAFTETKEYYIASRNSGGENGGSYQKQLEIQDTTEKFPQ